VTASGFSCKEGDRVRARLQICIGWWLIAICRGMIAIEEAESVGRRVVATGPLAPFAAGFGRWLVALAYSRSSSRGRLEQFGQISRWIEQRGLPLDELTEAVLEEFLAARRAAGHVVLVTSRSTGLPLEYLREIGVVPQPVPVEGPVERLLLEYRVYLTGERGLAAKSIDSYTRAARLFLTGQARSGALSLERLTTADVSAFLARECPKRSVGGARDLVLSLRPLFRYLHVAGFTRVPLQWAVPPVRHRRHRALAHGIGPAAVARLLDGCERRTTVGSRDYAIVLLLARLGLRAGEVTAIQLADIDWRAGELLVRGKGNRHERLPLPVDVGEAIIAYLQRRPGDAGEVLFVRVTAPRGPLSSQRISLMVHERCERAGIAPVGAHRLRHSAATGMLAAGASLEEIAQVLRHSTVDTTSIYARVDRDRLRALARQWPGGVQ
jgi:integrase/recombinase XerD